MKERCDNCRFYEGGTEKGACQRYPPRPGGHDEWPVVSAKEWCGEWQMDTPRVEVDAAQFVISGDSYE